MKRLLPAIILALLCAAPLTQAATPVKGGTPYDGLRISGACSILIDWQAVRHDASVRYVYLDVPASAIDAAYVKARNILGLPTGSETDAAIQAASTEADSMLVRNMRAAHEAGLEVGLCFPFADTLSRSFIIRTMLRNIPAGLSSKAPMISIPAGEKEDRTVMHRRLQIWTNALDGFYGRKPVLMATREVCKAYLAPVLSTIYPICLVHPEGPGMRQYTSPYPKAIPVLTEESADGLAGAAAASGLGLPGAAESLVAFPIWSDPE